MTKAITVSDPERDFLALLNQARTEDLIVRLADGSEFFLAAVASFAEEVLQTRKQSALMALLEQRAQEPATIALEDVKRELDLE